VSEPTANVSSHMTDPLRPGTPYTDAPSTPQHARTGTGTGAVAQAGTPALAASAIAAGAIAPAGETSSPSAVTPSSADGSPGSSGNIAPTYPAQRSAAGNPSAEERSSPMQRRRWRWLLDQLGAILLSLALAVVIWLIAVSQANPLITQDFPERINITVRGLDPSLQPVQPLANESVRITIRAPRAAWDDLDLSDFSATVDLTGYNTGIHDVPVKVAVNDPRVTMLEVNPPSLRTELDLLATRTFTVAVQILDAPAFGYDWQTPVVSPPTVTVRGPATQVDLIDQLAAPIYLLSAKSQIERTVELRPVSRQNQVVTGIEMSAQYANVVVPVEQWPGRKEVAVRINLVGQPSPGYRLSTVRTEPSTVVLQGVAELLATVPGYIETEPLSIDGATSEVRTRLNLVVPDGVTVFDGNTVQAVVSITPIEGGTTLSVQPVVQGLAADLEANVSPDIVDVILSGPLPLLESLSTDDMFVILDLNGLLPGTHVVTPRVVLPEGIRQEGILPETVEVIITSTLPPPSPASAEPPANVTAPATPTAVTSGNTENSKPGASPSATPTPLATSTQAPQTPPSTTVATPTLTPAGGAP